MAQRREHVAIAAFAGFSILAGANAVGVRFSNRELDPLWGAGVRFMASALVLALLVAAFRAPMPRGRALLGATLYGVLGFGATYALAYYALQDLHAGLGQILLALVPLATLVLAAAERQERVRARGVVGVALSLAGVILLVRAPSGVEVPALSVAAGVGSAVCAAQATLLVRRFPPVHPLAMNTVGMGVGATLLLVMSLLARESAAAPQRPETWAALAYLVLIGSVVVFVLYLVVLRHWAASRVAYGFVIMPFVTVSLSAWLDDEPIHSGLVLGGLLILAGVYLGALRAPAATRPPTTTAGPSKASGYQHGGSLGEQRSGGPGNRRSDGLGEQRSGGPGNRRRGGPSDGPGIRANDDVP